MRIYHFSRTPIYKSGAIFRSNWCHLKRGPTSVIQIVNSKYPLFRCWSLTLWILIAADKESLGCGHYYCIKSVSYINRKKRRNRMVLVIEFECHIKGKWYRWHIFREALIVFFFFSYYYYEIRRCLFVCISFSPLYHIITPTILYSYNSTRTWIFSCLSWWF